MVKDNIAVKVEDLSYSYLSSSRLDQGKAVPRKVLDAVSFKVAEGEKISIIGPNGAGKSTLLLNLAGLVDDRYREGSIEIYGRKLNKKNIYDIRENIGFVFQDPNDQLFSTRVFDDVAFGLVNFLNKKDTSRAKDRQYIEEIVSMSLKSVNMDGFQDNIPHFLSFGEKKLVALATVLSYKPGLLILDEPVSNLDPGNRKSFIRLLGSMDKTIISATHDLDMAWDLSERCIIINKGSTVFDGSTRQVLKDARFLRENNLDLPLRFSGRRDPAGSS